MNTAVAQNRSVVIERNLRHAPAKVWRALTQGALMEEWLMKNDFQPVVGHRFKFRSEPNPHWDGIVECEVLVVEPNQRLSYRWGSLGLDSVPTRSTPTGARHTGGKDSWMGWSALSIRWSNARSMQ